MPRANAVKRLAQSQQDELLRFESQLEDQLRDNYRAVLARLDDDVQRLTDKIAKARAGGERVSESWLFQKSRLQSLERQVVGELEEYGDYVADRVTAMQGVAVSLGEDYAHDLMRAGGVPPRHNFAGLPKRAVQELVGRSLSEKKELADILKKYPAETVAAIKRRLVVGVALGYSPKKIAAELQKELGGSLQNYLTVARTEMLGAHRAASLQTYAENAGVVKGWKWLLGRSDACEYCQSKSDKEFGLKEPFETHPRCRCSCTPVLKENS